MIVKIADNILSPLGNTTAETLAAVSEGRSALSLRECWQLPDAFMASLFAEGQLAERTYTGALKQCIAQALSQVPHLDIASPRTVLILSSTKGDTTGAEGKTFGESARALAAHFGFTTQPITVSNACISGLSSQILAMRLLESGCYDTAVVAGCDILNHFIVSGFSAFHSLSDEECRPFDEDRFGLNLGEAAVTVIYQNRTEAQPTDWVLSRGCVRNDAYHISAPSKTAEGSFLSLSQVMQGIAPEAVACLSAHGTATLYNDDMESKSIGRANLTSVLVGGLKGYFGHTLGAAGLLESVLMMHALDQGFVPATRGFAACGTSCELQVSSSHVPTSQHAFVKMMSGFGGCNAAALFQRADQPLAEGNSKPLPAQVQSLASIHITPQQVVLNGQPLDTTQQGMAMLTELYKSRVADYPKYYKMDPLARLGFLATELLLQSLGETSTEARQDRAIVMVNRSASVAADRQYEKSIIPGDDYFPSPSDFVYTLPNIVTGEVAIRHHYHGETLFLVIDRQDPELLRQLLLQPLSDPQITSVLGGWLECEDADHFEAKIELLATPVNG